MSCTHRGKVVYVGNAQSCQSWSQLLAYELDVYRREPLLHRCKAGVERVGWRTNVQVVEDAVRKSFLHARETKGKGDPIRKEQDSRNKLSEKNVQVELTKRKGKRNLSEKKCKSKVTYAGLPRAFLLWSPPYRVSQFYTPSTSSTSSCLLDHLLGNNICAALSTASPLTECTSRLALGHSSCNLCTYRDNQPSCKRDMINRNSTVQKAFL